MVLDAALLNSQYYHIYQPLRSGRSENNWIHTFPKSISAMWNAISLAVFISYDDNHYTTGTSNFFYQHLRSGRIWHKVNF